LYEVQSALITVFKNWGIPRWIKVDNGRPFGDPQLELIPPLSLWLIGLGIKVIWNKPRCPQQNAKVERSQDTMARWTDSEKCKDYFDLQLRLWEQAHFYNYHFPLRAFKNITRIEVFPKLIHSARNWNPNALSLEPILAFLSKGTWKRSVSKVGQINMYNRKFSVGMAYKGQRVSIKLCPIRNSWIIYDSVGKYIKSVPTKFTKHTFWQLDLS
jgi:transposase InsO family protein